MDAPGEGAWTPDDGQELDPREQGQRDAAFQDSLCHHPPRASVKELH